MRIRALILMKKKAFHVHTAQASHMGKKGYIQGRECSYKKRRYLFAETSKLCILRGKMKGCHFYMEAIVTTTKITPDNTNVH